MTIAYELAEKAFGAAMGSVTGAFALVAGCGLSSPVLAFSGILCFVLAGQNIASIATSDIQKIKDPNLGNGPT